MGEQEKRKDSEGYKKFEFYSFHIQIIKEIITQINTINFYTI